MSTTLNETDLLAGLLNRSELRTQLGGCTERTIQRYEQLGLPVFRRGRLRFYDIGAVRAWLRGEERARRGGQRR
jgi:hypothetical protein